MSRNSRGHKQWGPHCELKGWNLGGWRCPIHGLHSRLCTILASNTLRLPKQFNPFNAATIGLFSFWCSSLKMTLAGLNNDPRNQLWNLDREFHAIRLGVVNSRFATLLRLESWGPKTRHQTRLSFRPCAAFWCLHQTLWQERLSQDWGMGSENAWSDRHFYRTFEDSPWTCGQHWTFWPKQAAKRIYNY